MTSMNDNSCWLFATPGLTFYSNGEHYVIRLFSERPIAKCDPALILHLPDNCMSSI